KDKLIDAVPGAIRDLELLPTQAGFDPGRFVALVVETRVATIAWIVANWLVEVRQSSVWTGLRDLLGQLVPRARYGRLFSRVIGWRTPPRQALRLLARAGSDRFGQQLGALCV